MDTKIRVVEWFGKMGYAEKIPDTLGNICNPSTSFVWEQIINHIKPKQEVQEIHNNIIVNRLRKNSIKNQSYFEYAIKEIEIYNKKHALQRNIQNLENEVKDKEAKVDNLLMENKMKYIRIDNLKLKIKECGEKAFILNTKSSMLAEDIQKAKELLNLIKTEAEGSTDIEGIKEIIKKCAIKLSKLINDISSSSTSKSMKFLQQNTFTGSNSKIRKMSLEITPNNKRESLGLLSDSCLNISNDFLGFSPSNTIIRTPSSVVKRLFPNDYYPTTSKKICNNDSVFLSDCSINFTSLSASLDQLTVDKNVTEDVKNLLNGFNRQIVIRTFHTVHENLFNDLERILLIDQSSENDAGRMNVDKVDLSKLYLIHVKNELEIIKYKASINKLNESINKSKDKVFSLLNAKFPSKSLELKQIIKSQIKDVELDAVIAFMKKELAFYKKIESTDNDLKGIVIKIKNAKKDIAIKTNMIEDYLFTLKKIFQSINGAHEQTVSGVRRLNHFVINMNWAESLNDKLIFNEIKLFEEFPLEYNRRCSYLESKIFYRNICSNTVPVNISLDPNMLYMLMSLLDMPFSSVEVLLLDILRSKEKLTILKSLQCASINVRSNKIYSLKELRGQENYVQSVLNKLNLLNHSSSTIKALSVLTTMKKIVELWLEMPFKNFISAKRLVEGRGYKFYDNEYNKFYDNI